MTDDRMAPRGRHPTDKELAGFLRLLLAGDKLPPPSEEVMAYLESLKDQDLDVDTTAVQAAKAAIVKERLNSSHPRPIRPFGSHLLAKRSEAGCRAEDVAALLGERVETLRGIETARVDPLSLGAGRLATIADGFGLALSELREAIAQALSAGPSSRAGTSFARSREEGSTSDALRLAADDLMRASRAPSDAGANRERERIDEVLADVRRILEDKGLERLIR